MWNQQVVHMLGNNFDLSKRILMSYFRKFKDEPEKLVMIDNVFRDQEEKGIIERIPNPEQLHAEHPYYSYLAHMPIFKPEKKSSPCRVVFLSNLNGKGSSVISHNQAMLSGPSLNRKLSTALISLRFNRFILCFDLKKAFLQIELNERDQNRLLFLWFRNVQAKDFSLVTYRNKRLSFGLRPSPAILMIAMFIILMLDTKKDSIDLRALKKQIFHLLYMDNGSVSANSEQELREAYMKLAGIFRPYKFELQQFATNLVDLQCEIDDEFGEKTEKDSKLLGVIWNRENDTLCTEPMRLDETAKTKRQILKTIASNFDPYGYNMPLLNRARLFLHTLQCDVKIKWDTELDIKLIKEWKNIAKQVNSSKPLVIPRKIGKSDDSYNIIAFTDSSKSIYGVTLYMQNVNTNEILFLMSKNRMVNKQLSGKSIPSLEFHALAFGAEILIDTYDELTGTDNVLPTSINNLILYTDSYIALNWLNSYVVKLDKLKNLSVFTINRLSRVIKLCEKKPITFKFVSGVENPADFVTRAISSKKLRGSNYLSGPKFLYNKELNETISNSDLIEVTVPSPLANQTDIVPEVSINAASVERDPGLELYDYIITRYSTFRTVFNAYSGMFRFINKLKARLIAKNEQKFKHLNCIKEDNLLSLVTLYIIRCDQQIHFSEMFRYFNRKKVPLKEIPELVKRLNVYPDKDNILRVNSKFSKKKRYWQTLYFPILLSYDSVLAKLMIRDLHIKLAHVGRYTIMAEFRKMFWLPKLFSFVKNVLTECFICNRFNHRAVRLNQNAYRNFRVNPPAVVFQSIFLDYLGPYTIKFNNKKFDVWILVITCMWSRAINLEISFDLTTKTFIESLQLHIFKYGLCQLVLSDMGSQLKAGGNKIETFIKSDPEIQNFFSKNNIKTIEFEQYAKGNHALGSLVEICVKMTRRLIYGAIRNLVLTFNEFYFIVQQTKCIVNRRPIVFHDSLRENEITELPEVITPESLIHGRSLTTMMIIPELHSSIIEDPDFDNQFKLEDFSTLVKARNRLIRIYNEEVVYKLIDQAINESNRFKPVGHRKLLVGDVVLIKDEMLKPQKYPLGIVKKTYSNELEEVTSVDVLKGDTKEILRRHVYSIIPLLTTNESQDQNKEGNLQIKEEKKNVRRSRKAALKGSQLTREWFEKGIL